MIIDCEASLVMPERRESVRYSRAKIGLASDSNANQLLIVITSQMKEKFRIVNNCSIRSTTLSFKSPKKDLYIKNCDHIMLKAFMNLISKIIRRETIPKLAHISNVEKMKPKQTSLTIRDNNYNINDLSNKCLTKLFCEKLKLIPRLVWKLNNLTELKLSFCDLNEIPLKLNDLGVKLKILNLSHNSIKSIDGSFLTSMKVLNHLDLSHNKLFYIPFEIKAVQSLDHLNVSNNQLSHLPYTLGRIVSLKSLNVSHNSLPDIPYSLLKELLRGVRLTNLDISDNPLREPLSDMTSRLKAMHSFPSLQYLCCSAIVSNDSLLYVSQQLLPPYLYRNIQLNGELCAFCCKPLVDINLKLSVVHQSLESIANCLSTSYFPSFPLVPSIKYICSFCISTKI